MRRWWRRGVPVVAADRVGRDRAEGRNRPGGRRLGGVLAQAASAVVHHGGDLGHVGAAVRVGQAGCSSGPGALRLGKNRVDSPADAGVEDSGDVAGSGQIAGGDGGADDLGGIQAG